MNHSVGKSMMINLQNDAVSNMRRSNYCSDMEQINEGNNTAYTGIIHL